MQKRVSTVPFKGTPEQKEKLLTMIGEHRSQKGLLMPIMQQAQEIYGYLPMEVQQVIADELDIPLEEVYGVATFYSQFALSPKGQYKVSVCLGTACYVKGSQAIFDRVSEKLGIGAGECTEDGKFSLEATRCVGACGLAPVMIVNDEVYGRLVEKDVDEILAKYDG
jgi:NADP-reducing hydrogenase subunit HndA